jgi:hypothetical protein
MALAPPIPHSLAQPTNIGGVIGWSLVLIILLIAGAAGVMWLRRWMKEDDAPVGIGFTLLDLRQLHKQGKMTDAEYERARAKMLEAGRAAAAKLPHPLARPAGPEELRSRRTGQSPPSDDMNDMNRGQ